MRVRDSQSDPIDFCQKCFPKTEADAFRLYGNKGDGPDGRGNCFSYDDYHPDYDGEGYKCAKCRKILTDTNA